MNDTAASLAEQLEQVNQAITSVLAGGQSYKIGNRSLTRASLSELKAMRDDLQSQLEVSQSTGLLDRTMVAVFDGR